VRLHRSTARHPPRRDRPVHDWLRPVSDHLSDVRHHPSLDTSDPHTFGCSSGPTGPAPGPDPTGPGALPAPQGLLLVRIHRFECSSGPTGPAPRPDPQVLVLFRPQVRASARPTRPTRTSGPRRSPVPDLVRPAEHVPRPSPPGPCPSSAPRGATP